MDSPYYSVSELCGCVVKVSFSKYPPWQKMHYDALTTLHTFLENVLQTVCRKLQEDGGAGGFDLGAPFS
jgi:hypothetical protein